MAARRTFRSVLGEEGAVGTTAGSTTVTRLEELEVRFGRRAA
jgi:hypothetical protein